MDSAELFRLYGRFVARLLYRLGVPAAQIDDAVQDVFVVVHQRGGYQPGPAKPTGYLAVIATHAAARMRRAERVRAQRSSEHEPEQLSGGAAPDHGLHDRASLSRVRAALERLDPTLGATLLLADGEDEPCTSIAAAMGVPVGTVYWRLHRARTKFVSALKQVDAELAHSSPRPAARGQLALTRKAIITMLFGWQTFTFQGSEAHALLKETSRDDSVPIEVPRLLEHHIAAIERGAPLPSWAPPAGVTRALPLKLGAVLVGAGVVTVGVLLAVQPAAPAPATVASAPAVSAPDVPREPAAAPPLQLPLRVAPAQNDTPERVETSAQSPVVRRTSKLATSTPSGTRRASAEKSAQQAEPPSTPQPPPGDELGQLARAAALAQQRPVEALTLLEGLSNRGLPAYLNEERLFITVIALRAAGRISEARSSARTFLDRYPHSGFASRIRAMQLVYDGR